MGAQALTVFCMTLSSLHANLRTVIQARINRGSISVKLLSARTGISQPHLSMYIHGKKNLSVSSLSDVLHALGFMVDASQRP